MKINVTAIGKFQGSFPARTSDIEFDGATLQEFLDVVREKYGLNVSAHRNLRITLNSTLINDFAVPLQEGDRVAFIPIVAGG